MRFYSYSLFTICIRYFNRYILNNTFSQITREGIKMKGLLLGLGISVCVFLFPLACVAAGCGILAWYIYNEKTEGTNA